MGSSSRLFSQLVNYKNVVKSGSVSSNTLTRVTNCISNVNLYSTAEAAPVVHKKPVAPPVRKMSKAMLVYLERAKAYDSFIQKEKEAFKIGKRHLANMMGEDPENFTQSDIDNAIEYLFPSGLFDKQARPLMKPPEEIFPPRKAAEFGETGRPHHSLFYTIKPNYYQVLHDIVGNMKRLDAIEDANVLNGESLDPEKAIDYSTSDWVTQSELEKFLIEPMRREDYRYLISSFQRLADHPYAYEAKDFIMKFRKERIILTQSFQILPIQYDADGRPFVTVSDCMRKTSRAIVTLKAKGSGKITINGKSLIRHFRREEDREQIIFPLQFVDMMEEFDIEAQVWNGGPTGQSGAIRWGISWALRSFITTDVMDKMRVAGLLTRDWRRRERKKPGQEGARRKFTWNKR